MSAPPHHYFNPILSKIVLEMPRHLHPESAWISHTPFAMALCEALRPRCLVELGTHRGVSYLAFCQAIASLNIECKSFAVDTWSGDKHSGAYDDSVYEQLRKLHREYDSFSSLLRMTFDEAVSSIADNSVDLLHIDGLHTYEAVKKDFITWKPKLSDRAVVLFHDTQVFHLDFAVHQLWKELSKDYPNIEFQHGYGLGVLFVGNDRPEAVNALLETASAHPVNFHKLFKELGVNVENTCNALHVSSLSNSVTGKLKRKLNAIFRR